MIEINGKNLVLRSMNQKEMRALWRKFEPENSKNYVYDEEKVDLLFEKCNEREDWNPVVGIFLKNDEVIGQLTFARMVFSECRCELNIFLATEGYRNKGYGTEAVLMAKSYAKNNLGMKKIYADVSSKNLRAIACLKKCGFLHGKTFAREMADGGDRLNFVCIL